MAARSTKGVTVCLVTGGATGNSLTITDITKAAPAVVTVADTAGMTDGDIVNIGSVGFSELDGREFVLKVIDGTTFSLTGSDTLASQGAFVDAGDSVHYPPADMTCMCFSEFVFNPDEPETISTGTYCDPTAQISSAATAAGTVDFGGFIDITSPDYRELRKAEADNNSRLWRVTFPENGYLAFPATIAQVVEQIPIDGALQYTGNASLGSKPVHLFD